ncbi:MAG: aldo/keto reductase [Acidobacteria bacterium]|nr:aldo/keto reductase [Acidobacteriota bacterium]
MKRREFVTISAIGLGAIWIGSRSVPAFGAGPPGRFKATDMVTLGKTGIKTSRLAMGTGSHGFGGSSNQGRLGLAKCADMLWAGYDHGLRFIDTADAYGTHPHVREALKRIPREKVTILTKSWNREPDGIRADIERYRKELNTDYIDIFLMHCLSDDDWTTKHRATMDVISEFKQKGIIRAHGCSCHTIGALRAAAKSPWVEVDLARLNPIGHHMDADPETVKSVLREMRAAGKGVVGMKILAQGDMGTRRSEAIEYALASGVLDAFTIGCESRDEQSDIMTRIAAIAA